ncbi:hypothetical protein BJ138DRAFT_964058, partial [Hygrophoropsis aurantiaca]
NMNMFNASGSQTSGFGGLPVIGGDTRPMSTFFMVPSFNAFAGPSLNPNPMDDDLFNALRGYLGWYWGLGDRTAREAMARFPKADLAPRRDFLNQSIDKILS